MVAAILIGLVDTFGKVSELEIGGFKVLPTLAGTAIYVLMAGVLVWWPQGIFGRKA
jgi:branched-chain amino acid transport system permease protein